MSDSTAAITVWPAEPDETPEEVADREAETLIRLMEKDIPES